jgi:hypothetical protein
VVPHPGARKSFPGGRCISEQGWLTFEGRETTVEDQLEIAELALGEDDGRKGLGLGGELIVAGSIAREQVLEDAAVRWVGHYVVGCKWVGSRDVG